MATVGRGADQYTVRFPDGLRDRIKAAAEANNRSMNAEIVLRLEHSFDEPSLMATETVNRIVDKTVQAMVKAGWRSPNQD